MPTVSGLRRKGYTAEAIVTLSSVLVLQSENLIDIQLLEFFVREDLNKRLKGNGCCRSGKTDH